MAEKQLTYWSVLETCRAKCNIDDREMKYIQNDELWVILDICECIFRMRNERPGFTKRFKCNIELKSDM